MRAAHATGLPVTSVRRSVAVGVADAPTVHTRPW
jgi:hypothetical protein